MTKRALSHADLLELKRWNTPTIYNGWEQITAGDPARDGVNLEPARDFMPQMGVMVGYAVTLKIQPGEKKHKKPEAWSAWRKYVASIDAPKIVVVQDLDKPALRVTYRLQEIGEPTIAQLLAQRGIIDADPFDREARQWFYAGFRLVTK